MIRINKSLEIQDTPSSLRPAFRENFLSKTIPQSSNTTTKRRCELIRKGEYIDNQKYNDRYKLDGIKAKLTEIYHQKCAYCEQRIEQFHVEHYRPKSTYYWLAYSWDNLLCACASCNTSKGKTFQCSGAKATVSVCLSTAKNINTLSAIYDLHEQPNLINPEVTDPSSVISFDQLGKISSEDDRFKYTIQQCKIDRKALNDSRKKILDDFRKDLKSVRVDHPDKVDQGVAIKTLVSKFIRDTKDPKNEFLAFRSYLIKKWLLDEIKSVTT